MADGKDMTDQEREIEAIRHSAEVRRNDEKFRRMLARRNGHDRKTLH